MRCVFFLFCAAMFSFVNTTPLIAQGAQYSCSVVHFLNSDNDREFERINRDKKF